MTKPPRAIGTIQEEQMRMACHWPHFVSGSKDYFGDQAYQYAIANKQKIHDGLLEVVGLLQKMGPLVRDTDLAPSKKYDEMLRSRVSGLKALLEKGNLDTLGLLFAQKMLYDISLFAGLGRYQQQVEIYRASLDPLRLTFYDSERKRRQRARYNHEKEADYNESVAATEYREVIYGKFGGKIAPIANQEIGPAPGTLEYDKAAQEQRMEHYDEMRRMGASELRILWEIAKLDPRVNQAFLPEGPAEQMLMAVGTVSNALPMPGTAKPELVPVREPVIRKISGAKRLPTRPPTEIAPSTPTVRRFSSVEELNQAANAARPNTRYEYGNYSWTTDAEGRVSVAEGRVTLGEGGRNKALQTEIGNEGASTDIGFHLIADSFNAPTNRLNVVPGNGVRLSVSEANLNQGAWKRFENQIRSRVAAGDTVDIKVEAIYNPGNTSTRPDVFRGSYRVNGGDWITRDFPNKK